MMLRLILFLVFFNTQAILKNVTAWKNNDVVQGLSWVFDVEEQNDMNVNQKKSTLCKTRECRMISNEFSKGMNKSVNPCDNFYDYVCGAWNDEKVIPPYIPRWGHIPMFQEIVVRRIKEILETTPSPDDILPIRQAKKWYRSCVDEETLEKRGLGPLESIMMQAGGWPMTIDNEEWDENAYSWQNVEHHYFEITGSYIFYKFSVPTEFYPPKLKMEKGNLPLDEILPSKYRNYNDNDYDAYVELIENVVRMFVEYNKADVSEEMIKNDVRNLVEFERKLNEIEYKNKKIRMSLEEFLDFYNTNVTELLTKKSEFKKINFHGIFGSVFDLVDDKLNYSMPIFINDPTYYIKLTELMNHTSQRTLVNYIHWHFVSNMLDATTDKMRNLFFTLMENEFDIKERAPRWLECAMEVKMNTAMAYAFVKKYFPKTTDVLVLEMINNIKKGIESSIEQSQWLNEQTKNSLKEKLNTMKTLVGFPEWYNNRTAIIDSYKGLIIGSDHFENVLNNKKFQMKQILRRVISSHVKKRGAFSIVSPIMVNGFYNLFTNVIELPAATFQPPLFTSQLPWSVNYGLAGIVVGHEISHAFDNIGITIGNNGHQAGISRDMLKIYFSHVLCFLEQFNNYYEEIERKIDGTPSKSKPKYQISRETTLAENIADSTGLYTVFDVYKKMMVEKSITDYKLPGFEEYTDDQLFFISYAALWCGKSRQKYEAKMREVDPHSPNYVRVIGAVSNTDSFATAFNCPKQSPMNPAIKCNIWKQPTYKFEENPLVSLKIHRKGYKYVYG